MITVQEIKKKADQKYDEVLQAALKGQHCFPLSLRANKALSSDFVKMSQEIAEVVSASKDRKGFGYSILSEAVKTQRHGIQDIPRSIIFETLNDYLKFIGNEQEFLRMLESYNLIKSELPELDSWLIQNPRAIIANTSLWPDLIKVCQWFLYDFEPHMYYIRELPISVHTKFIEENKPILRVLLDKLIPDKINLSENNFERRFHLKYVQPLIRLRSLDISTWDESRYDDLTVPLDQLAANPMMCARIFIIENNMNFLTFPSIPKSIAIWGKGFAIESLKDIEWLREKGIYYWSDLDAHGFQMLSQLRSYFPQTKSLFMEFHVLELYKKFVVQGTSSKVNSLSHLSADESKTHQYLLQHNLRLEQERIPQNFIKDQLNQLFEN